MDRSAWSFALASVAATIHCLDGRVDATRVVLGGVASIPWRSRAAEDALIGRAPDESARNRASDGRTARHRALRHNGYKRPLLAALVRRALVAVVEERDAVSGANRT